MTLTDTAPPPTGPGIAARAIDARKTYGEGDTIVEALAGVTVDFVAGQFTAIMGPSGSGKSTLMHCLAGLDGLTGGSVWIEQTNVSELVPREGFDRESGLRWIPFLGRGIALVRWLKNAPERKKDKRLTQLRRDRIGFVFQAFNLVPTLTAEENITLPLALAGQDPDPAWFATVVSTVGLGDRLRHRPSELSGGQQQRVAVARALASRPAIIFADEPTGNLDSRSSAEILGFMRSAVDTYHQTIVMVTHDPVAASYADRVLVLADGKIVHEIQKPTTEAVVDFMKTFGD